MAIFVFSPKSCLLLLLLLLSCRRPRGSLKSS